MKKLIPLFLLCILFLLPARAEGVLGTQYLGGGGLDMMHDAVALPDGGALLVGTTGSEDGVPAPRGIETGTEAWAVRLDSEGGIVWQLKHAVGEYYNEFCNAVPLSDGTFLLAHASTPTETGSDYAILVVSDTGEILSETELGNGVRAVHPGKDGLILEREAGTQIEQSIMGGGGLKMLSLELVSPLGRSRWMVEYPDLAGAIIQVKPASEGYLVYGYRMNLQTGLTYAMGGRLSEDGKLLWQATMQAVGSSALHDAAETEDGGMLAVGRRGPADGDDAASILVSFAPDGTIDWGRPYGFTSGQVLEAIRATPDGFVAAARDTNVADVALLYLDEQGNSVGEGDVPLPRGEGVWNVQFIGDTEPFTLAMTVITSQLYETDYDFVIMPATLR